MKVIIIGAPSLTGRIASELLNGGIEMLTFPVEIEVKNLVAHGLQFPEVDGLQVESCAHGDARKVKVSIKNADVLFRLVSSMEQVAELFNYREMLSITFDDVGENSDFVIDQEKLYAKGEEKDKFIAVDGNGAIDVIEKPVDVDITVNDILEVDEATKKAVAESSGLPEKLTKKKGAK